MAYKIPGERVDGQDVLAVREATARLLRLARDERQPSILECMTYRYRGHSPIDPGKGYRSTEEPTSGASATPSSSATVCRSGDCSARRRPSASPRTSTVRCRRRSTTPCRARSDPADLYQHIYGAQAAEQFARMAPGAPFGERSIGAEPLTADPAPPDTPEQQASN